MPPTNKLPAGVANARSLFATYRHRARTRGISFSITVEEFLSITGQACYLCGAAPAQVKGGGRRNGVYIYNGIDRVDNLVGYETANVKACCKTCNFLKGALSLAEFKGAIHKIVKHLGEL